MKKAYLYAGIGGWLAVLAIIGLGLTGTQNNDSTELEITSQSKTFKMNELAVHPITKEDSIAVKVTDATILIDQKTPKGRILGESFEQRSVGKYTVEVSLDVTNLGNKDFEDFPYRFELADSKNKRYSPEISLAQLFLPFGDYYSKGEKFHTSVKYLIDPPMSSYTFVMTQDWSSTETKVMLDKLTKLQPSLCQGLANCIAGFVTKIVDGDTLDITNIETNELVRIRLALVDTPEIGEPMFNTASEFTAGLCGVGTYALFDEDDGQTEGSFDRKIGKVYCEGVLLNEQLLQHELAKIDSRFCQTSEYGSESWVKKYGCEKVTIPEMKPQPTKQAPQTTEQNCDPSYPTVCISPPPPDLNCGDIPHKKFKVLQPDPHRFDGDKDGIGCEK